MVTARAALLGLALLSARTNADECTNLIDHVDYKGHDVGSTAQPDAADCCGDCSDHDSCKVWVWTNYHGGTCWFKSQGTEVTAYYGAKSGALPTPTLSPRYSELADNVDYYGNDISTTKQKFAESCGEDCDITDGCQLFVWTSHEGGTCWLKHSHSGPTDVYGVKSAYRVPTTTVTPAPTTMVNPAPTTRAGRLKHSHSKRAKPTCRPTTTETPAYSTRTPASASRPTTTETPAYSTRIPASACRSTTTATPAYSTRTPASACQPTTTATPAPTTTVTTPAPTTTVTPTPPTTVTPAPITTVTPAPKTTVTPAPATIMTPAPSTTTKASPKPTTGEYTPTPSTDKDTPEPSTPDPTTTTPDPTTTTPNPTTTTPHPTTTTPDPTTTTPNPTTTTPYPTTTTPNPTTTTPTPDPTTTTPNPTTTTPSPTTTTPKPAPVACPPRVRKPWNVLDSGAKRLFLSALEVSMDRGLFQRFLAIHNDMVSNKEAHNSCVFWFWHRKYMLAFEDMLRDLGPSFACVTLTYFDWVEDYANFKAKKCSNFGTCSPILKDFGGAVHTNSSTPASSDLLIFDHSYPDLVCADASPNNHFCPVVEPGARCDHCLPRNATSWTEGLLSEEWDVDILKGYLQLAEPTPSIKQVSADIELGAHGMLHALLGGVMGNPYSSPADSIFYAHHTAVDMLHAIYHHCKVEPLGLAEDGKKSFIQSFEGCTTGNDETITATSRVQSKVTVHGVQIDAEDDKLVGKYFKDLPSQYWELTDTRDFGARAYSYQFNGLLARLYTNCGAAEPVPGARSAHEIEHVLRSIDSPADQNQVDFNKEALAQGASQGLTPTQVETELKKMALLVKAFCLPGSVVPYSDEFKAVWKIRDRRPSVVLLEDLKAGRVTMQLANWRAFLATYFECTKVPATIV